MFTISLSVRILCSSSGINPTKQVFASRTEHSMLFAWRTEESEQLHFENLNIVASVESKMVISYSIWSRGWIYMPTHAKLCLFAFIFEKGKKRHFLFGKFKNYGISVGEEEYLFYLLIVGWHQGRRQGEGGKFPSPETEKIVVEKWCYFRKPYF